MGYDCFSYLPDGTNYSDVEEFVQLLGYKKNDTGEYIFFERNHFLSLYGVMVKIIKTPDKQTHVQIRTHIYSNKYDIDYFNNTAKQLRKRFGGYFRSDFGKNRYISVKTIDRAGAEAGCYIAFNNFQSSISLADIYTKRIKFDKHSPPIGEVPELDKYNPSIISNNMVIPFLVSILEEYYRFSYISILRYSDRKDIVLKKARINNEDLFSISERVMSVEAAVSRRKSFQNMNRINENFRDLDKNLDIHGILSKPFRKQKDSLFKSMEDLIEKRHRLVHISEIRSDYTKDKLLSDIIKIKVTIERSYHHFVDIYNWHLKT